MGRSAPRSSSAGTPMQHLASFIDLGNWLPSALLRLADPGLVGPGLVGPGCQPGPGIHAKPEVKDRPRAPVPTATTREVTGEGTT